jgi:hypothetical protein
MRCGKHGKTNLDEVVHDKHMLCLQALIRKYMPVAVVLGFLMLVLWARSYFWGRR